MTNTSNRNVRIIYTNHALETSERNIQPSVIWFGHTAWHPEEQWLLTAFDVDKQVWRDFAMKDILSWHTILLIEDELTNKSGCA